MDGTHSKLIGFPGAHRFYRGRPISGTLYFFTLGLLFIGWIVDLWTLNTQIDAVNRSRTW